MYFNNKTDGEKQKILRLTELERIVIIKNINVCTEMNGKGCIADNENEKEQKQENVVNF